MSNAPKSLSHRSSQIAQIRVEKLFGYLNYKIPKKPNPDLERVMILYGDNGAGKTTLLRLVFALLFPRNGGGHRTRIAQTPFHKLEVLLDDGTCISAYRTDDKLTGSFTVSVMSPTEPVQSFNLTADEAGSVLASKNPELAPYLVLLEALNLPVYLLSDDRQFHSSALNAERETVRAGPTYEVSSTGVFVRSKEQERSETHHLPIKPVLERLSAWLRQRVISGSSAGDENAVSIYLQVADQLAGFAGVAGPPEEPTEEPISKRLVALSTRTSEFAKFGLVPIFPAERFVMTYSNAANDEGRRAISRVLGPYLRSVEARLSALEEIRSLISIYIETANEFLVHKYIDFSSNKGVTFYSEDGSILDPEWLSSGERQLMLLLSNTILARESGGIFLIDEPELSLNVKWQRRLISALLRCAGQAPIQYIMATHSLELVSLHLSNVVQLEVN